MLIIIGMGQNATILAIGMFLFMLPLPIVNSLFISIMQAKVPPDLQGRVFAAIGQISMLLTPLAYLISGPLVDKVFEPAVETDNWAMFQPLVGNGTGAGMGLMFVIAGVATVIVTTLVYARPSVRNMESELPDYVPVAAKETSSEEPVPDANSIENLPDSVPTA